MIKKITFLFTFLLATVSFAQTELLSDPGFESTTDLSDVNNNWHTNAGTGVATINSDASYVRTGSKSGNLVTNALASNLLHQVDLEAGKSYMVEFYIRDVSDSSTKAVTTSVRVAGVYQKLTEDTDNGSNAGGLAASCAGCTPAGAVDHIFKSTKNDITNNWQKASFIIDATTTATHTLFIQHGKNDSENIYLDDVSVKEIVSETASIEALEKFNFSYGPNPTTNSLRLSAVNPIKEVEIFNLVGQQIFRKSYNNRNASIDLSNYPKGMYVLKVNIENSVGTFRVIKD